MTNIKIYYYEEKYKSRQEEWSFLSAKSSSLISPFQPTIGITEKNKSVSKVLVAHITDCIERLPGARRAKPDPAWLAFDWNYEKFMTWMDYVFGPQSFVAFYSGRSLEDQFKERGFPTLRSNRYLACTTHVGVSCLESEIKDLVCEVQQWVSGIPTWPERALEWLSGALIVLGNDGDAARLGGYILNTKHLPDFPFRELFNIKPENSKEERITGELSKFGAIFGSDSERWKSFFESLLNEDYRPEQEELLYLRNNLLSQRTNETPAPPQ